jgi:pyridoxal phosphate phosphatase PHOSPHO2
MNEQQPRILQTLHLLQQHQCEMKIISDANIIFIETILKGSKARDFFTEIITNSAYWDEDGRLHVGSYHNSQNPHTCPICDINLCKGLLFVLLC